MSLKAFGILFMVGFCACGDDDGGGAGIDAAPGDGDGGPTGNDGGPAGPDAAPEPGAPIIL